jgi:hypothetical protein
MNFSIREDYMKKVTKIALAASVLILPVTGAQAMPPAVPTSWQTQMLNTWANIAEYRPCNGPTIYVCGGHF